MHAQHLSRKTMRSIVMNGGSQYDLCDLSESGPFVQDACIPVEHPHVKISACKMHIREV
jgi:hypothetical protein